MSTRGNIIIHFENGQNIYLYQHCDGYNIGKIVQAALKRKERWDDEPYLARIIFSEMIKDHIGAETGYGISSYPTDNSVDYLVVDCYRQQIFRIEEKDFTMGFIHKIWTFDQFIKDRSKSVQEWLCLPVPKLKGD